MSVSQRYARALYELAKDNKTNEKVFDELRALKSIFEADKVIHDFISSPMSSATVKAAAIKKAFAGKVSDEVTNTILLMADKGRLGSFSELVQDFEVISDNDHGVTRGTVRSAAALSPESRNRIEETVTKVTGKKVILNFTEDPKLLGGMVAQVGGWTFDDSLESHLTRMSEELNRRMN